MKYRLKQNLPWIKAGGIVETDILGLYQYQQNKNYNEDSDLIIVISINCSNYPDFFEPINEEDENLEEAKKLLESSGYLVVKIDETLYMSEIHKKYGCTYCQFERNHMI